MHRNKIRTTIILALLTGGILVTHLCLKHSTSLTLVLREIRYSPATLISVKDFVLYWQTYLKQLRANPKIGLLDFEWLVKSHQEQQEFDDFELGKLFWHGGDFALAVSHIESYHRNRGESESSLFWLAMSYLRLAESKNCLSSLTDNGPHAFAHEYAGMCALPLTMYHRQEAYARTAAKLFQRLLDSYDDQNRTYQWLLNFCYMTVGGFPDEVPQQYLIRSSFIDHFYGSIGRDTETQYAFLSFNDRAKQLNVDTFNAGKGVAVEDFDRDGYLDIVTGGQFSGLKYYRNDEGCGFIDVTREAGLENINGAHIITAADYNNDGWMDLFVSRPLATNPPGTFNLLRNNADATFTDVTDSAFPMQSKGENAKKRIITWVSAWGDVDNDGDLDLFLANLAGINLMDSKPLLSSKLYLNDNNRFTDKTAAYGLKQIVNGQAIVGAAFGDYDNDGFEDLAITGWMRGFKTLLKNVEGKRFKKTNLVLSEETGFMTSFVDVNHDGQLDLFCAGHGQAAGPITAQVVFRGEEHERKMGHSTIWLQKDGEFEPRHDFFGGHMPIGSMGANYGDINNDGAYDFYLGTGNPEGWFVLPNLMYIGETDNQGRPTGYMTNISMLHGFGTIQKGHGIVFFDFDNDGDQDIYSSLGGMWPGDAWPNQLFVNESKLVNTWTKIRLRGRKSNYYGLGAKLKVVAENVHGHPIVRYYHMSNKTGFGSAPYLAHIGLLDATQIKSVEVTWPGEKIPRVYPARLGQLNILDESNGTLVASSVEQRALKTARLSYNSRDLRWKNLMMSLS